jgi:hypothetical protein
MPILFQVFDYASLARQIVIQQPEFAFQLQQPGLANTLWPVHAPPRTDKLGGSINYGPRRSPVGAPEPIIRYSFVMRQERCRVCRAEAVFVAILHDGARVSYCPKHLPTWKEPELDAYRELLRALRQAVSA